MNSRFIAEKHEVKSSFSKASLALMIAWGFALLPWIAPAYPAGSPSCAPAMRESMPELPELNFPLRKLLLADGGGTSGGGDSDGLKAATQTLSAIRTAIKQAGPGIYTDEEKNKLLAISDKLKIIMVQNRELPAKTALGTQEGSAFSAWIKDKPFTALAREKWNDLHTALDRESLLHHELCVLAGIEATGDYTSKTAKYAEFRKHSWKFKPESAQVCMISLFRKKQGQSKRVIPGEPIGVASAVMDSVGARGGMEKIGEASPTREIRAFYVIDSSGYLRLQIAEVDRQSKDRSFLIENKKVLMNEVVIVDPYEEDLYPGSTTKNFVFGDFFMNVSCTSAH